ncbi:MAG: type II toxin-antitoxin system RelE/ParE family toxin [Bacteriovoracales bacterium]|nr:type II toxin-antitoxin system RelE/ParE family toxin [Bacteriovoracales bacterium]
MQIKEYLRESGKSPYGEWLKRLDSSLKYRIQARIMKLKDNGHFGFSKQLAENLYELKFKKLGGGIRVYYGMDGRNLVILLCGGNKGSQSKDIKQAQGYWDDYRKRNDKE